MTIRLPLLGWSSAASGVLLGVFLYPCFVFADTPSGSPEGMTFGQREFSVTGRLGTCLLRHAYDRLGIHVQTQTLPYTRSARLANVGELDGEVLRGTLPPDYHNLERVPVPLVEARGVLFARSEKASLATLRQPGARTPAVLRGNAGTSRFLDAEQVAYRVVNNVDLLFNLFTAGKIDYMVVNELDLSFEMARRKLVHAPILVETLYSKPLYHTLNRRHQALVPRVADVLQQLQGSGELDRLRTHFVRTWTCPEVGSAPLP